MRVRFSIVSWAHDPQLCLQWHGAEVKSVPDGAKCLATSEDCAIQALDYQGYAFGVQYHVEITEKTVAEWGAVPAYATALEQVLGKAGLRKFEAACESALPACNALARQLYDNANRCRAHPLTVSSLRIDGSRTMELSTDKMIARKENGIG